MYNKVPMNDRTFTIVDVETTGGHPRTSRVIELGILRVERGEVAAKFKSLVNPGCAVPEFISKMTGITTHMVNHMPYFEELAEDVLPLFEDSVFVAHNSGFDYGFLRAEFARAGLNFNMDSLCTVRLSRALYPKYKRHNLSALIERFDFKCKSRHRAFDDALVLWDFLQHVRREFPQEQVNAALRRLIRSPFLPAAAPKRLASDLVYEPVES